MYSGYFDGATSGNPGPSGIGCIIKKDDAVIWEYSKSIGHATNNISEYKALIRLLEEVINREITNIDIFGDSQLVIFQLLGNWQVKQPHLEELYNEAMFLLSVIKSYTLNWIPRKQNFQADKLASEAIHGSNEQATVFKGEIEKVADYIYLAHGTNTYAVDIKNNACTCPSFVNNKTRPCKHLTKAQQEAFTSKRSESGGSSL